MTKTMSNDSRVGDSMADNSMANMAEPMAETVANNTVGEAVSDHTMANTDHIGIGGGAIVGHLGHIACGIVGVVVDMLDAAVRQVDGV